jgi:mannose-6-phosphate isomerase-like protein (cupin superfamily)
MTPHAVLLTLSPGTGDVLWFLDTRMIIKATASTTNGQIGLVEAVVPPGHSPPLHIHHADDEIFWIIEGHLTYRCGDETFPAAPGSYVRIPRGVPHTFVIEGDSNARYQFCTRQGVQSSFSSNWVVPPKATACHHEHRWISSCWHGLAPSSIHRSWGRH